MQNVKAFLTQCKLGLKKGPARIILAEAEDERVLEAAEKILEEKIAELILVGEGKRVLEIAEKLKIPLKNPNDEKQKKKYAENFYKLRKGKGVTEEEAKNCMNDRHYFATMMLQEDEADGLVTGSMSATADILRPVIRIIGTKEKFHKVSGFFFMVLETHLLLFADCAVTIDPNSHDLVDIAIDTAETAKQFGIEPRIAMLSFSTNKSARHPNVEKIREAVGLLREQRPDLIVEGEMQVDAALVPEICAKKFPSSQIKGDANILIFPNLDAGNIAYKLVERLAKAQAIGPILQGLKKPINELSRGCSVQDIIDVVTITSCISHA